MTDSGVLYSFSSIMTCYKITHSHSAMHPGYIGSSFKYASTEDEALKSLATKQGKYDKNKSIIIDKFGSTLHILSINEES